MASHLTMGEGALWAALLNLFDDSYATDSYLRLSRAQMMAAIWNTAAGSSVASHLTHSEAQLLAGIVNEVTDATVSHLTHTKGRMLAIWFNEISDDPDMSVLTSSSVAILAAIVNAGGGANDPLPQLDPGVLTWTSGVDDNTPNLSLDLPDGVQDGDIIRWQVSTTSDFSGGVTNQDGSDVGSDPTVFEWPDTLSDAQYWIRALIVRDSVTISTSNTETKTINTEAFMKVALEGGFLYPGPWATKAIGNGATAGTMDAATEKVAFIGRVYWDGRPGSAKTISAAGGGAISFSTGAVTFANGSTTIEVGLQDVSASANTPDGTFDVSRVLTGGADTISANAGNTFAMTGGSGSKSLTHGDLVAVVFDMTARAGSDSVIISGTTSQGGILTLGSFPGTNTFVSSAWSAGYGNIVPNIVLVADDGTVGTLDGASIFSTIGNESFGDGTNPDERGFIFQTNFDCDVDGIYVHIRPDADFTAKLYSTPLATPTEIAAFTQVAEVFGQSASYRIGFLTLATPVSLTAGTDYCFAFKATEATSIRLSTMVLFDESHRSLLLGGETVKKATRNNGSGAFTAESPAVTYYSGIALRVSHIHTPA